MPPRRTSSTTPHDGRAGNTVRAECPDAYAEWVAVTKHELRHRLVDDDDPLGAWPIGRREGTAAHDPRSERREVVGTDAIAVRAAGRETGDRVDARGAEEAREAESERHGDGQRCPFDAGQSLYARERVVPVALLRSVVVRVRAQEAHLRQHQTVGVHAEPQRLGVSQTAD